jgi:energy-coupling factor transporter ATP-binding protein EcfA2
MTYARDNRLAKLSREAPRMPWDKFLTDVFKWEQGEHVALIGPTGQGKTTLLTQLLPLHPFVTVFATKPRDESMERLIRTGYYPIKRWQSLDPAEYPRRVLWPDASLLNSVNEQREVFHDAFARIYREGGWTVAIDELWYINNVLKLEMDVKLYLLQARALGISLLAATQRPAWVPLEIYDQSTHLFFWRDNDETNLRRLSGISFRSADLIRSVVSELERFQVLYINTRTGEMFRTRAPKVTA